MKRNRAISWIGRTLRGAKAFFAVRDILVHLWERVILSAMVRGIKLPGARSVQGRLSQERQDELERRILVREIKRSRLLVQHGPLWLGRRIESLLKFFEGKRIFLQVGLKLLIAFVVIVIPVITFIIIRGVLPVPARIPFGVVEVHLPKRSNLHTEWPYTGGRFSIDVSRLVSEANILPGESFRGATVVPIREQNAPPGLMRFSVGSFPARVENFRGFLVSEKAPLQILRQRDSRIDIAGQNRLQVRAFLFPSPGAAEHCRLEVRNQEGELLLASESGSKVFRIPSAFAFGNDFRERLTPLVLRREAAVLEHVIETDEPPKALTVTVRRVSGEEEKASASSTPQEKIKLGAELTELLARGGSLRDVSGDKCVFGLGHFAYEKTLVRPLPRRGIVFIAVDFLRSEVLSDAALMPNVRKFFSKGSVQFEQHFASGNSLPIAMASLFASRPYGDLVRSAAARERDEIPSLESQANLQGEMVQAGYRLQAIGRLSYEDQNPWPESVLIENRHYDSRSITEEAGNWLEEYGQNPFFLYLHYGTFQPPFRPPFDSINLTRYLGSPFGIAGERELEAGLARYWDQEFVFLMRKLEMLGILNEVDVFLVSTHGGQVESLPYGNVIGAPVNTLGAVRSQGPLTEDELHVPFLARLAEGTNASFLRKAATPTTHLDVAPTLARIAGIESLPSDWNGVPLIDVGTGAAHIVENRKNRGWIYAESPNGVSVFRPMVAGSSNGMKLVRFFSPYESTAFLDRAPWRRSFRWDSQEVFSSIDRISGREEWSWYQREIDKHEARRVLMENLTVPLVVEFSRQSSGAAGFSVFFSRNDATKEFPKIVEMPFGMKVERRESEGEIELHFSGSLGDGREQRVEVAFLANSLDSVATEADLQIFGCGGGPLSTDVFVQAIRAGICLQSGTSFRKERAEDGVLPSTALRVRVGMFRGDEVLN